jgi:predicted ArsR family transcriptional regulator
MGDDMPRSVTVSDDRILSVLHKGDDPVRTVPKMAEEIDLSRDGLRRRLIDLEERGLVTSKTVGANAVVWWPNGD